eukprot:TRINITY_DN53592_c0_g1_i1.p1 TRINITY_DN53592_c0_g1~~TRINITY_DN53592_c0_g1_i1.p1  ORF type:complete len:981 (+),score=58.94 TRINITY_DN53592_c0_g1_i1:22-2943(+)
MHLQEKPTRAAEQKRLLEIEWRSQRHMTEGSEWCALTMEWWTGWKLFTRFSLGDEVNNPTGLSPAYWENKIDNFQLEGNMHKYVRGTDFVLVPLAIYQALQRWYKGGPKVSFFVKNGKITTGAADTVGAQDFTIHLTQAGRHSEKRNSVTFSSTDTVETVFTTVKSVFKSERNLADLQLVDPYSTKAPVKNSTKLAKDLLPNGSAWKIEFKKSDGTFGDSGPPSLATTPVADGSRQLVSPTSAGMGLESSTSSAAPITLASLPGLPPTSTGLPSGTSSRGSSRGAYNGNTTPVSNFGRSTRSPPGSASGVSSVGYSHSPFGMSSSSSSSTSSRNSRQVAVPGHTGLQNLGNTCFMNSAIQCLCNTTKLREFFTTHQYEQDINDNNPLGHNGKLAKSFAELLHTVWSGQHTSVSPTTFRSHLTRFAPQFSGWQQHDSQELLAFMLDGLHEDLNRVKQKEFVELKESDGRPDRVVAKEAWENHLKRNQSIVVDLFQGQLKSTLQCPDDACGKISITFDPFMYLSLPVQQSVEKHTTVDVIYVPHTNPTSSTVKCRFSLLDTSSLSDLRKKLGDMYHCSEKFFCFATMYSSSKINNHLSIAKGINALSTIYTLVAYSCPMLAEANTAEKRKEFVKLTVTQEAATRTGFRQEEVHYPLVFVVPKNTPNQQLYSMLYERLHPLLKTTSNATTPPSASSSPKEQDDWPAPTNVRAGSVRADDNSPAAGTGLDEDFPTPHLTKYPFVLKQQQSTYGLGTDIPNNGDSLLSTCRSSLEADTTVNIVLVWSKEVSPTIQKVQWPTTEDDSLTTIQETTRRYSSFGSRDDGETTLSNCLNLFTKREVLNESDTWYCNKCKRHQRAYKEMQIWRAPPILVVHLKRFQYNTRFGSKLSTFVDFPKKSLDIARWLVKDAPTEGGTVYDLYAVSHHSGSLYGGHYTATALSGDSWMDFNDSRVSTVRREDDIVSSSAYVLFYQKRGM